MNDTHREAGDRPNLQLPIPDPGRAPIPPADLTLAWRLAAAHGHPWGAWPLQDVLAAGSANAIAALGGDQDGGPAGRRAPRTELNPSGGALRIRGEDPEQRLTWFIEGGQAILHAVEPGRPPLSVGLTGDEAVLMRDPAEPGAWQLRVMRHALRAALDDVDAADAVLAPLALMLRAGQLRDGAQAIAALRGALGPDGTLASARQALAGGLAGVPGAERALDRLARTRLGEDAGALLDELEQLLSRAGRT